MRFLIAGLGSIGRRHLRNLAALKQKDIILLRSHRATLPEADLEGYPVETDIHAALEKYRPDAVVAANPTALHMDVAIPAAKAGCSILLEKPVSNTLDRLDELAAALRSGGGQLLVGFQFHFHPTLQKAAALLSAEAIGRPLSFHIQWGEYLPSWHPWEDFKKSYAARSDLGGGVILTLTHPLDYLRLLLGDAESLWALTGANNLGLDVEDTAEIGLKMVNGAIGSIHVDYNQRPTSHRWEIVGSNGTMKWDNATGALEVYRPHLSDKSAVRTAQLKSRNRKAVDGWKEYTVPQGFERNVMFLHEMKHFIEVARKKVDPICDLEDGKLSLQLALAAYEAARTGRIVKMPFTTS